MKSGLLWYDGDKTKKLSQRLNECTSRFYAKYGFHANCIYINPGDATRDEVQFEICKNLLADRHVALLTKSTICPNHIWLGVDER